MDNVYAWVSLLTEHGAEALILELVKRGYAVGAMDDENGKPYTINTFGLVLAALELKPPEDVDDISDIRDTIEEALRERDVGFHICIVSQTTGCTWSDAGNFITTGKPPAEQPTMWERLDE